MMQKSGGAQDHSGGAETALDGAIVEKRLLEGVQSIFRGDSFYSGDLTTFTLASQDQAGVYRPTVKNDGTGTAFANPAAFFGAGKVEFFPEEVEEAEVGGDAKGVGDAVNCDV